MLVSDIIPVLDPRNIPIGLVDSIRKYGIITPIIVRRVGEKYEIIDGRHRYAVAMQLGLTDIPAQIVTDEAALEAAFICSPKRIPTNPVEYAKQLKRILEHNKDLTIETLATKLNKSVEWLNEKLNDYRTNDDRKPPS
jgi:ParB family transcriptional regulator, chromosome partitioning protein